jgi:two-component system aerobic respiration control sensor histidine kinase ArcB
MDMLEQVIGQSAGNLYWKDGYGRYMGCNENFKKLLGLRSVEEIVGKRDSDFLPEEKARLIEELDRKVLNSGETITQEEEGLDKDGNKAFYLSSKSPLKNSNGDIVGVIGSSLDITKEKQAEKAKQEFVSSMSHDLRTPFSGVLTLAEILHDQEKEPSKKRHLYSIVHTAKAFLKLVDQVMEVSLLDLKKKQIKEFDLHELIHETKDFFIAEANAKNITLVINCPIVRMKSDKEKVGKILLNLLSNAIKFTGRDGQIILDVKVSACKIEILVSDTGIGVPKDKQNLIFEKFVRLSRSYEQKDFTGSGVGLYVAKKLAQELGGKIKLSSQVGTGSTFTALLPCLY